AATAAGAGAAGTTGAVAASRPGSGVWVGSAPAAGAATATCAVAEALDTATTGRGDPPTWAGDVTAAIDAAGASDARPTPTAGAVGATTTWPRPMPSPGPTSAPSKSAHPNTAAVPARTIGQAARLPAAPGELNGRRGGRWPAPAALRPFSWRVAPAPAAAA